MPEPDQDPTELALNQMLDATPVLLDPQLDEETLQRFIEDVAQGIHTPEDIARRYGFPAPMAMIDFIARNREVRRRIKVRRAIWESDDSIETRIRRYAGVSVLEAIPSTARIMFDPLAPTATRLDAVKVHARMAGVDSMPASAKGESGGSGTQFSVNFHFSDGRTEKVVTTVAQGQPVLPGDA